MGDEPRRSGRATKGINPKHQQETIETGTKKSKAKGKGAKKQFDESPSAEHGEEEAIIRCICGIQDDEGGRVMICCDNCAAWQHNDCMGVTEDENEMPDQYFCEQCRPQDHKELLDAINRGEKPWEEAAKRREEARRKKKGRGGRKSKSGRQSRGVENQEEDRTGLDDEEQHESTPPPSATAAAVATVEAATVAVPAPVDASSPSPTESSKRKFKAEAGEEIADQPSKLRKASSFAKDEAATTVSRRKSSNLKQPNRKSLSVAEPLPPTKSINELQNDNRKKIAIAMRGKLEKQLRDISKKGLYRIPDGDTPSSLAEKLSVAIEHSLYLAYCHDVEDYGGAYKNQFTSILFNLQANSSLLLKVMDGRLTTDELAKMSSTEMASEELQQQMASMKEEADKQSVLIQDVPDGPRVRRTHKGEELVDDQSNQITSEPTMPAPPPRRRESEMVVDTGPTLHSPDAVEGSKSPLLDTTRSSAADGLVIDTTRPITSLSSERRSSSNFDIQNVWSSVHSPNQDQSRPSLPSAVRSGSGTLPVHGKRSEQNDADIDRLLDEDGNESPPYSPAEFSADTSVTWRGNIDMPITAGESVAKFKAVAHHVAGTDLAGRTTFNAIFPSDLVLHGRIEDKRADKYLTSLSAARSTDVTVHSIVPAGGTDSAGQIQFDKLFTYFVSRQRYGVVGDKLHRPNVRDIYVVPLDDGFGDMPMFLQRLDFNVIEQPRPQRMLLIVFVLRWEEGVSSAQATPSQLEGQISSARSPFQQSSQLKGPVQTPVPKADAAMSPITAAGGFDQGFQPPQQASQAQSSADPYGGQFPQNPYIPPYGQAPQNISPAASGSGELAKQILGVFYTCPTAQTIVTSQPDIPAESLRNLRQILEAYPATQHDMASFQEHLSQQHKSTGNLA